ncbi:VWA domain-containing protein [Treponema sp.]|uniref:vWA domain-containing protein n=1 Tax=Treponema sp. TaxID=166 RepID=UPI00257A2989|nr:VWA domain-containing protein [Treponema sp.]MBE6353376.1 VWA domain-containing protein [Treponema sp.]
MGVLDETIEVPRKTMCLFFLVDGSGSMSGDKIGSLNQGIREVLPDLRDISDSNADALIKVAVLQFSSGTQWITPAPQELENIMWTDIEAGGVTDMGEAFTELDSKLNRNAFLADAVGNYAPVIILMSDGEPTDDWDSGLKKLKANKWFNAAIKIAFSIGSDANDDILTAFTGNKETVIPINNKDIMKKMIRFVSVTSSRIGSKKAGSSEDDAAAKQAEVAEAIQSEMEELDPEENYNEGW